MHTAEQILTTELKGQRTLAAIAFTDVVSFSALMAANEEYTLDLLRRDFQVMKQLCQQFEGQVLKTIGDALLIYFNSAVHAVACAQAIQSTLAEAGANLAPEDILTHRIGVHLGDVFFNGTDVMGDGVNIAARLQAEAEPGGICISQTVYEVVKNALALKATGLMSKKLKNIKESVSFYQISPLTPTLLPPQQEFELTQPDLDDTPEPELVIRSSGQWVLLHEHFFQVETFCQNPDGTLTLKIPSHSVQDDGAIQSLGSELNPPPSIKFAYGNEGFFAKIRAVESAASEDYHLWTITLEPEMIQNPDHTVEQSYQGRQQFYSPDDIAQLRARRILLNDPPKLLSDARLFTPASAEREKLEQLIRGNHPSITTEDCVLQDLYPKYKDRPHLFLELARLEAIFLLKTAGIVAQVLELSLSLIGQDRVSVRFRGKRRHVYVDVEPAVIEVEGDYSLVSEV